MAKPDPAALEERVRTFRSFLEKSPDDATTWYGLGRALADLARGDEAAQAFARAVEHKPDYTAAWRDLGKARLATDDASGAADALRRGLEVAERTGDLQTGREMRVFLKRAERREEKTRTGNGPGDA